MTGEICAAVLGKGEDFVLILLPADERSTLALEYAAEQKLPHCGVMGFVGGKCYAKCEPGWEAVSTMMSAAPAFARYVHERLKSAGLMELSRLHNWSELT